MKVRCEVLLRRDMPDGTVRGMAVSAGRSVAWWWREICFGSQGNIPETVGGVASSNDDDLAALVNFHVVFGEEGDAVIVTKLTERDKGARLEMVENVSDLGIFREVGGEWNDSSLSGFDGFAVGDLHGRAGGGVADAGAVWCSGGFEVVAGGAGINDGGVGSNIGGGWD